MTLVVSVMFGGRVRVAVQVMPRSCAAHRRQRAVGEFRSALVKPLTASLKVLVTSEGSADFQRVVGNTIVAARAVSITEKQRNV